VIGHNVFRVVPNEVLVLFLVGIASVRLRGGGLAAFGLARPASWGRAAAIGLGAAVLRILLGDHVVFPIAGRFWPPEKPPELAEKISGDLLWALLALLIVWTLAAFGEEFVYRGYLLARAAQAGGGSPAAHAAAVALTSILFGYGHAYKGPAGILDSGVAGLVLGAAFQVSGRNLWACILAHGLIDTSGVAALYFGWEA
jgi:membrane protease YdiL (CAAX protease family)